MSFSVRVRKKESQFWKVRGNILWAKALLFMRKRETDQMKCCKCDQLWISHFSFNQCPQVFNVLTSDECHILIFAVKAHSKVSLSRGHLLSVYKACLMEFRVCATWPWYCMYSPGWQSYLDSVQQIIQHFPLRHYPLLFTRRNGWNLKNWKKATFLFHRTVCLLKFVVNMNSEGYSSWHFFIRRKVKHRSIFLSEVMVSFFTLTASARV